MIFCWGVYFDVLFLCLTPPWLVFQGLVHGFSYWLLKLTMLIFLCPLFLVFSGSLDAGCTESGALPKKPSSLVQESLAGIFLKIGWIIGCFIFVTLSLLVNTLFLSSPKLQSQRSFCMVRDGNFLMPNTRKKQGIYWMVVFQYNECRSLNHSVLWPGSLKTWTNLVLSMGFNWLPGS